MADEVYIVDPGGYVGESTRREIAYAESLGKPVAGGTALAFQGGDTPFDLPDDLDNFSRHEGVVIATVEEVPVG